VSVSYVSAEFLIISLADDKAVVSFPVAERLQPNFPRPPIEKMQVPGPVEMRELNMPLSLYLAGLDAGFHVSTKMWGLC
jgi:hypothetical protein